MNTALNKLVLLSLLVAVVAFASCEASPKQELDSNDLNTLRNLLGKYVEIEQSEEQDDEELRPKKSILLPRIGSAKRSPIVLPRIGYEKKRGYHMPRIGRNLNEAADSQEQEDYDKRAFHMPRIGRK